MAWSSSDIFNSRWMKSYYIVSLVKLVDSTSLSKKKELVDPSDRRQYKQRVSCPDQLLSPLPQSPDGLVKHVNVNKCSVQKSVKPTP